MPIPDAMPTRDFAAAVLLPLPLAGPYDYRLPEGLDLPPGTVVEVPLGRRTEIGVVWGPASANVDPGKLRDIHGPVEGAPLIAEVSRRFIDWVADYTLSPPGAVLRMALSVREALAAPKPSMGWRPGVVDALKLTAARRRVLAVLEEAGVALATADLATAAAVGPAVIKGMAEAGLLVPMPVAGKRPPPTADGRRPGPVLSPAQAAAASALVESVGAGYSATLLDGVTGSGKTEVYFEAVAEALRQGQQVLVLVPEIALTAQWLSRFAERFGAEPAEWHSELTPARRRRTWRAIAEGSATVVVGARSALFLPYRDLGLIVVDEEHEGAFKQEDGVTYNARDMAVVRGYLGSIPVVLASATPSLETQLNAEAGRYRRLDLPSRHGVAQLPDITALDLRRDPPVNGTWGRSWLAPSLVQAVERTLEAGEQALLFLNRRGYAPLTLCRTCGHRLQCPNCTAWLVEHRKPGQKGRLLCHHCGYGMPIPEACPSCASEGTLTAVGPGVERVAEEAIARFPEARTLVVASDSLAGPHAVAEAVQKVADREIDLLIGTQLLAKGLHFPHLTLVGVVDADLGLEGGDLRAAERTYQLLSQVAGRAGRGERPGSVILQTWQPDHPVMSALARGDSAGFLATEAEARRLSGMPPYGRLVALILSGPDVGTVTDTARALAAAAPRGEGLHVFGPAPAPLSLLRGRHRVRLLFQAPRTVRVQPLIRQWLASMRVPREVHIQVDVDPYSFL